MFEKNSIFANKSTINMEQTVKIHVLNNCTTVQTSRKCISCRDFR